MGKKVHRKHQHCLSLRRSAGKRRRSHATPTGNHAQAHTHVADVAYAADSYRAASANRNATAARSSRRARHTCPRTDSAARDPRHAQRP